MAQKNYYTVLGVNKSDGEDTIKKAYRKLAKKYHPDLNPGDKAAEAKMGEISEAWETLGDAERRKKYDRRLSGAGKNEPFVTGKKTSPRSNRPITQEEFNRMSKVFDDILSPDAIKKSGAPSKGKQPGPMNPDAFFESVMGFKGAKKK